MNELKKIFEQKTNATLKKGTYQLKLKSIIFPEIENDKTPYCTFIFELPNGATTTKNLFAKDLELMTYYGKNYYNVADTNASLQEITEEMQAHAFPVTIDEVTTTQLDGTDKTFKNWHFFTDKAPQRQKGEQINEL